MAFGMASCSKEESLISNKKTTEWDGTVTSEDYECEYVLEPAPTSLLQMIANNPTDPKEEELDTYMYYIARAISKYSCISEDFENDFYSNVFTRYDGSPGEGPAELEVEIQDLVTDFPDFATILNNELSAVNHTWLTVKPEFTWEGMAYTPTVWLENPSVADWSFSPLIGVGTDLEYSKEVIGDFIPALYNECEPDHYEPIEMVLGKVNPMTGPDTTVSFSSQCVENPILIVQLSWEKGMDEQDLSSTGTLKTGWIGEVYDTVIPGTPPPGPGCTMADNFTLFQMNMGCKKFERGRYCELYVGHFAMPSSLGTSYYPYKSENNDLRRVNRNKKCQNLDVHFKYYDLQTKNPDLLGQGSYNLYSITYEYDWYASWRGWTFPFDQVKKPRIGMKRKAAHQHYQISVIKPTDWCFNTIKEYTSPRGNAKIIGRKL